MRLWRFKRHVFYRCERSHLKHRFLQIVIRLKYSFKDVLCRSYPNMCGLELSEWSGKTLTENNPVWDLLCVKVLLSGFHKHKTECPDAHGSLRCYFLGSPRSTVTEKPKKWNCLENFGLELWSQVDGIREDRQEDPGDPPTVNAPGVCTCGEVSVPDETCTTACARGVTM